eukprot:CAMPEP_0198520680 /NCGR_PEP_ID=MMETSP1462-20131121/20476_1 /TAXON_ID=1333877 /ORGANISM="Brandtodinium nutriculum, Strain RCC3387" /LENGTH=42 /DNA_ID= /DNA_START= /DNA_END= /DNA_ORIENTATION=
MCAGLEDDEAVPPASHERKQKQRKESASDSASEIQKTSAHPE